MKKLLLLLLVPALAEAQVYSFNVSEPTAARRRMPVVLVDATDGESPETAIAIAANNDSDCADATDECCVIQNGGTPAYCAGTLTHRLDGVYDYEFTAGELNTCGYVGVTVKDSAAKVARVVGWVNCYHDGVTTNEAATKIYLASGAIDANTPWANKPTSLFLYNASKVVGSSCIVTVNDGEDSVTLADDLSAAHTTGDYYIIRPDAGCAARVKNMATDVLDAAAVKADVASELGGGSGGGPRVE